MADIHSVYGYMHDSARFMTLVPFCTYGIHQSAVAHMHRLAVDGCRHSIAGKLLYVGDGASVVLVAESCLQRHGDGVGGESLHVGGKMQQLLLVEVVRMDGLHLKLTFCQRAGLVEHHGAGVGKGVHIVGTFDKDASLGCPADAGKEGQRHGDDECTRAGYHKECERTVQPYRQCFHIAIAEEWRYEGKQQGYADHDRRVDVGEFGNEGLAL